MAAIRANSVLPARREAITLETADGLSLVGELALPADGDPRGDAGLPAPAADARRDDGQPRLPQGGLAAARPGRPGRAAVQHPGHRERAGHQSEGAFDNGEGERYDVAAAIEYAEFHDLPNIWLVGWSFGTDLTLMYGCDPAVRGAILLSPPLRFSDRGGPGGLGRVRQAADRAGARVRRLPAPRRGPGAVRRDAAGRGGRGRRRQAPVGRRRRDGARRDRPAGRPRRSPYRCRASWDGPMETGDASAYADRTVAVADTVLAAPTSATRPGRADQDASTAAGPRTGHGGWRGQRALLAGGSTTSRRISWRAADGRDRDQRADHAQQRHPEQGGEQRGHLVDGPPTAA